MGMNHLKKNTMSVFVCVVRTPLTSWVGMADGVCVKSDSQRFSLLAYPVDPEYRHFTSGLYVINITRNVQ